MDPDDLPFDDPHYHSEDFDDYDLDYDDPEDEEAEE